MARAPEVRAWPCDRGSADYKNGIVIANNQGGFAQTRRGQGELTPHDVSWEGIPWRVAHDSNGGVLYVLAPTRDVVETWRGALERLATVVADRGGVVNVISELASTRTPSLSPRIQTSRPMPKPNDKRLALNGITQAVKDAIPLGATPRDIRLAVFAAMGLDADATSE